MKRSVKILLFSTIALIYNILVYLLFIVESNFEEANITNMADAYWYSLVTLTTVGYGDFYPVTFWGRLIGFLFVFGSLGMLGYLITELNLNIKKYVKKREMGLLGTDLIDHCVIIGWNSFSKKVAEQVVNAQEPIAIVVDNEIDLKQIKQLYKNKTCFVLLADRSDFKILEKINITQSKRVYINFDQDTETLIYSISLKKQFNDLNCVVAIENAELKESFSYLGIQFIITKKEIISKFIASYIFEPSVALVTEDLISTSNSSGDLDICEKLITQSSKLVGKDYNSLFMEQKIANNIILLAVNRSGVLFKNPTKEFFIEPNDILVYISDAKQKYLLN